MPPLLSLPPASTSLSIPFGQKLLSTFDKFGYAYVSNKKTKNKEQQQQQQFHPLLSNLHLVRKASRKLLENHFPVSEPRRTDAVDSLRGFYNFQAASGKADDIRCFSIGHPEKSLGELRGENFYDDVAISQKRNVWPVHHQPKNANANTKKAMMTMDPEDIKILEDYYRMCSNIATLCASSIEGALMMRNFDDTKNNSSSSSSSSWSNWMSKQDNHLELKLYAGVDHDLNVMKNNKHDDKNNNNNTTSSSSSNTGSIPMKKSKILRRTNINKNTTSSSSLLFDDEKKNKDEQKVDNDNDDVNVYHLKNTRMDVHADLSVVTLLLQDRLGGLEVFDNVEKQFVTVPLMNHKTHNNNTNKEKENDNNNDDFEEDDDAILVHAGMFLEKWSNQQIIATPHRVRTVQDAPDRCSVVFFAFPDFDAEIMPIDGRGRFVAGDEHPKV